MQLDRRDFLKMSLAASWVLCGSQTRLGASPPPATRNSGSGAIDREKLVRRHNPVVAQVDPFAALTVGNGEFAFTADVTGLQTFPDAYRGRFPLCTTSHWAWHTAAAPEGVRADDLRYREYDAHGRKVRYATDARGQEPLFTWLRQNPHRLHLGRVGAELKRADGSIAKREDLANVRQSLDLWSGLLESRFELEGKPVCVQTCCHPELDLLAVRIKSPLLRDERMRVILAFPYGSPEIDMADWDARDRHETRPTIEGPCADFERTLDDDRYHVSAAWNTGTLAQRAKHEFVLGDVNGERLEFVVLFAKAPQRERLPDVEQTMRASAEHWKQFWTTGGAIDLAGCTDPRAEELERRIVLSQFVTALHCAGSLPSAETGLLFNSWFGKFHLEMHWWHSVHFAVWNRFPLFERSLGFYERILPVAREIAARQGYRGTRWPKMVGPDGHDSPSPVGPLLIWQQPHPIYYAELCYRHRPAHQTLERWKDVVMESAAFMADYAAMDAKTGGYMLGPPLKTVSENTDALTACDPTFELAYWRFGLRVAQSWRERLGLGREAHWDEVVQNLAPLPTEGGLYLMQEGLSDTYTKWNWEHPALLGALGMQPGDGVDAETMRRSVRRVMECWQWDRAWGWDFPMAAMAAARVGEPELAIQALLIDSPKNRRHPNGHIYQRPNLTAYLPANGGLLAATAMMAAGWTDAPAGNAPGFPANGKWSVKHENLITWL
jgi:hypothetical protein